MVERLKYYLPPRRVNLGYRKNYTQQNQGDLSTNPILTEQDKENYKNDYLYSSIDLKCNSNLYDDLETIDNQSFIYDQTDAILEVNSFMDYRNQINDIIEVTCPILAYNAAVILGVLVQPTSNCLKISSTVKKISDTSIKISDNNSGCIVRNNLDMGDTVVVNSLYFDQIDEKFVVFGIKINTKKLLVTYKLLGLREVTTCFNNIVDSSDNVIDGIDNIIDDF